MEPNYVRISEITGTRDHPVIKAVIQEEGKLGGHVLKHFTLPELNEFIRSSHILGSETGEVDHSGDPILTSVSHDEYLADVRAQVDHLFKNVTGSDTKASMGASGVLGRTLHIAKTPQRAVVPPPPAPRPAAAMPLPAARPAAVVTLPSLVTSSSMEASRSTTAEELKAAAEFFHVSAYYSSHIRVRETMIFGDITRNPNIGDIQRYVESHPVTSLTRDLRKFLEEFKRAHPTVPASQAQQAPRVSPDSVRVAPQMGVRSDTISGTHLREGLLPAPEGPEGYYVVDLMHPRRPPPSGSDTMAGAGYRHQGKEGDRLVDPQQVRKQYPIRVLPTPPHAFWRPDALGITEHGKHVIQQQALRSCVPTTVAMLLLDKGKTPDYFEVALTSVSNDDGIFASLREAGFEGMRVESLGGSYLEQQDRAIRAHGPIMLGIHHPKLAGHEIILDSVDVHRNEVTIRDPYYGAMLTISANVFLSWHPENGIQIK